MSSGIGHQLPLATVTGMHIHIYQVFIMASLVSSEIGHQLPLATATGTHIHIYMQSSFLLELATTALGNSDNQRLVTCPNTAPTLR